MPKYLTHPQTGETLSQTDWEKKLGLKSGILSNRLKTMSLEKALVGDRLPAGNLITHPVTGETLNQKQWAQKLGVCNATLHGRLKRMSLEKALMPEIFTKERTVRHPTTGETLTIKQWSEKLNISKDTLFRRLKKLPLIKALSSPKADGITHPVTGETFSRRQWARKLGIGESTLQYRLKNHSLKEALDPDFMHRTRMWTAEEDEYLLSVSAMPALPKHWNQMAKKRNWSPRSSEALRIRIRLLAERTGEIVGRRSPDENSGWLTMSQLASRLEVSERVPQRWIRDFGLKGYAEGERMIKIHLTHFAAWATSPIGSGEIAKTLKGNPLAINWTLVQIGNWVKEPSPPVNGVKPIAKERRKQTVGIN